MTAYNSQHARGGTQWLRRLARGCSWVVSMAAFADLDIRAGSDLKALRGLVETAAHRESVIFAPEPCPRYPSYQPVFSVVSPGAISVSRGVCLISIEAEDACRVARIPGVGDSQAPEEAAVAWACPDFRSEGENRGQSGRGIGTGPVE